ncbi:MAG: hypothetical protein IKY52_11175 [Clostridia bacterium]|nr:hypothetical protein [Clostridia bacterium]
MKRIFLLMLVAVCLTACTDDPCTEEEAVTAKPVIYLYPDEPVDEKPVVYLQPEVPMEVSVKLDYNGTLTSTYPAYGDGWTILAEPDGTLTDPETGREYYCLFWEGVTDVEYDFSTGFCVSGEDTAAFLEETLAALGLNEREANEFIIYWLPRMEVNPYNLISFQTDTYTENAKLLIDPAPDCMIRVFMAWKPLAAPVETEPQQLPTAADRSGFTVVEWGGTEVH